MTLATHDGTLTLAIHTDRPETIDLMRRHIDQLAQDFRDLGFSDQAIFDIAEIAAMYNFTNRLASATGMLPNREYHSLGR